VSDPPAGRPPLRVFGEDDIRRAVDEDAALRSAERAFTALARGEALVPPPLGLDLGGVRGEVHVKGAALAGAPIFAFKVATGFYGNAALGLPTGAGLVLVFDARTGFPLAVLADNGWLTDVRTAAAGALAARLLAPERPLITAVVGAGVQARLQMRLIHRVRALAMVRVWSPTAASRGAYVAEMREVLGTEVVAKDTVEAAVAGADLVVTVTPSREPLISADMLRSGVTVIAVGSDGPDKRELAPGVVAGADKVVTDSTQQCARLGELHHAVNAGLMEVGDVHAELGEVLIGARPGREGDETIVCDLTGVGAQDAAIAEAAQAALDRRETLPGRNLSD
jgi:ornithine cyclodeaminase